MTEFNKPTQCEMAVVRALKNVHKAEQQLINANKRLHLALENAADERNLDPDVVAAGPGTKT